MTYALRITDAAARDLEEIFRWIAENDSAAHANYVLEQIGVSVHSISSLPHRGAKLPELPALIEGEYRQVFFKPYRIIYEVTKSEVLVHLVADGRRNLHSLLAHRLARR